MTLQLLTIKPFSEQQKINKYLNIFEYKFKIIYIRMYNFITIHIIDYCVITKL